MAQTSSVCRSGDPLANVYHPSRLVVRNPCITVSCTVAAVKSEDDGDLHIRLVLDAPFVELLNDKNRVQQAGALVVEPVPADRQGCTVGKPPRTAKGTYNYGICTGTNIATPKVGTHVMVTGPYVLDTVHGWMEIHPAWSITDTVGSAVPTATVPPTAPATPGVTTPRIATATPTTNASTNTGSVFYANCTAARAAGVAPLYRGQPGYREALDADHDGVATDWHASYLRWGRFISTSSAASTTSCIPRFIGSRRLWLQQGLDATWGFPRNEQGTGMPLETTQGMRFPSTAYGRAVGAAAGTRIAAMDYVFLAGTTPACVMGQVTERRRADTISEVLIAHGNQHLGQIQVLRQLLGRPD